MLTLSGSGQHSAYLTLSKEAVAFLASSDTGFYNVGINGFYAPPVRIAVVTLNNRTFNNVITAMRDTASQKLSGLYKIWYTKTEGLVGYAEYPSLKTWVKQ